MLYGVITEEVGVKGQHELEEIHLDEIRFALGDVNDMELSTVRVQGTTKQKTYKMPFSAVHIIVPRAKKEEALLAAKDSGATGVTIMEAHGMGLDEMDNFYNRLESQATDVNLMLIVPTKKVNQIIRNVMHKLDIIGNGDGISYSYPISNLKGLTLKESDL